MTYLLRTLLITLLLQASDRSIGQQLPLQFAAGGGISRVTHRGIMGSYSPAPSLNAGAWYVAPFPGTVSFKTGITYGMKAYRSRLELRDSITIYVDQGTTRLHYLSVPLLITVQLWQRQAHAVSFSGGMSYGFLLKARSKIDQEVYVDGRLSRRQDHTIDHKISLLPPLDILPAGQGHASLYRFQPSVNGELLYTFRKRYIIRAFYEYNLYDATINQVTGGAMNLHMAGLSVGIGIGGKKRM